MVAGDLNVSADDPDPRLAAPDERYRDLAAHLDRAGLRDVWAEHGRARARRTFEHPTDLPGDPDEPDQVADREDDPAGERIDYLWLRVPEALEGQVAVGRPRRWAFTGRGVRGGPAGSLGPPGASRSRSTSLRDTIGGVLPPPDHPRRPPTL
ncbi:MAG: hypothetical protein R2711_05665 [Acidimicrobiales bacterium]